MKVDPKEDDFNANNRTTKYKRNIILLMLAQVFGIVVSLLLVPITLNYLGIKEYGVWITLTTIISWIAFFDIGLGHGLRNKYAEAKALKNEVDVRKYVSTAFFVLILISGFIFFLFALASPFINWATILNAPEYLEPDLKILAFIVIGLFCVRFVVNIITTLLTADQEPGIPMLIGFLGNLLSLAVVYWVTLTTSSSLLYIGIALSVSQLFPLLIAFVYLFATRYRPIVPSLKYFSRQHIRSIFSLGIRFFLIQFTTLIIFQSNNIIIAHVCGLEEVTEFNIAYKYMNVLYLAFGAFVSPLWSATTEAYVRDDIDWIRNSIKKLNYIWLMLIISGAFLIVLSPLFYGIWLHHTLSPDRLLLFLILVYFICLTRSSVYRSFMNGVGKISLQFYVTMTQSILHIPITIYVGEIWGISGVVLIMILWAFMNAIWEPVQFKLILTKKAKGIWNK